MGRARREYGTGSIVTDKHGQIWAKLSIGGGKYRRARAASTKEAGEILKQWRAEQSAGVNLQASSQRFDHYADSWLVGLKERQAVKPRPLEFYRRHVGYAAAYFGHVTWRSFGRTTGATPRGSSLRTA